MKISILDKLIILKYFDTCFWNEIKNIHGNAINSALREQLDSHYCLARKTIKENKNG